MIGQRALRMVGYGPDYYAYSKLYADLQQAIAQDLDDLAATDADVTLQLYIVTATWGLAYWETILAIPTVPTDSYAARRSRILAKWRGIGNFGIDILYALISAYTDVPTRAYVDVENFIVVIEFSDDVPGFNDMLPQLQTIIHAHLGIRFKFKVVGPVVIGQNPKLTLLLTDHMNFWNTDGAGGRFMWNGAYTFDGSKKFDGTIPGHTAGIILTQQHDVDGYFNFITAKCFSEAVQKWNRGFRFDGTRKFGSYTKDTPSCGNSVSYTRTKLGVLINKGAL